MRSLLAGICLLFCGLCATAQATDSFLLRVSRIPAYDARMNQYLGFLDQHAMEDFDRTVLVGREALQVARAHGDSVSVGKIGRFLGEMAYFKGHYDEAAAHFYHSMQLLERTNQKAPLAFTLNALAKLYRKTRDLPRALQHYERALALFRSLGDSAGVAMILNESGVVFEYAGNFPAAVARYAASLRIDEERRDTLGISYALSNLAGVYLLQEKYSDADRCLLQALGLRKRLRDTMALALNYSDLGSLYLSTKQLERARSYTDTSNRIAAAMGYRELQRNNFELLARIAEAAGNAGAALALYRQRSALQDSLLSAERVRSIEELNARYETLKKEQTIREQQYALSQKNFWLIATALLTVLGAALAYSIYRRRQLAHRHALQQLLYEQQQLATRGIVEAEETERQRIAKDLHDGIGQMMSATRMNLEALQGRLQFGQEDDRSLFGSTLSLVDESCRELRTVSHNMMPNALLKHSLAAAVRAFIDKIDHRSLEVQLYAEGLDERLDGNVETVLYRVVQECVNNVIRHAGATRLDISIIRDEHELTATIEDNGRGFDPKAVVDGLGMKNIRTRVEYLKGSVEFDTQPGRGTLVAIQVPL